jgi:hypothetical protein
MKFQQLVSLPGLAELPHRCALVVFVALAAALTPAWSTGPSDIIWLETNSTAGNSILAFRNDGSGKPTFLGSTPAAGSACSMALLPLARSIPTKT